MQFLSESPQDLGVDLGKIILLSRQRHGHFGSPRVSSRGHSGTILLPLSSRPLLRQVPPPGALAAQALPHTESLPGLPAPLQDQQGPPDPWGRPERLRLP